MRARFALPAPALALTAALALPQAAHAAPPPARLYVASYNSSTITVLAAYDGRRPIGQITDGVDQPAALCVDAAGTLYVSNANNTVTAYPPGTTSPSATYSQGIDNGQFCTTGPDNSLYVSNSGSNTVVQFLPYGTTPSRVISFTTTPLGISVDSTGTLYVLMSTGDIESVAPGATQGTSLGFTIETDNGLGQLAVDSQGNFVVDEPNAAVFTFAKVAPHNTLNAIYFTATSPGSFALADSGNFLYLTDSTEGRVIRATYPENNFANVIDRLPGPLAVAATPLTH